VFYAFYAVAIVILVLHFTGWLKRNNLEWLMLVLAVAGISRGYFPEVTALPGAQCASSTSRLSRPDPGAASSFQARNNRLHSPYDWCRFGPVQTRSRTLEGRPADLPVLSMRSGHLELI